MWHRQRVNQQVDVAAIPVGAMAAQNRRRAGSLFGNGPPLRAPRFALCRAQRTVVLGRQLLLSRRRLLAVPDFRARRFWSALTVFRFG